MTTAVAPASGWRRLGAFTALTKPRIVELLLITTVPAMILAEGGWPATGLVAATVAGGALSAGGANAINNVVDRDIDARMGRTRGRPLPSAQVSPGTALILGGVLGAAGFAVLWAATTPAAALLATGALLFYVGVYSLGLKRVTVHNIVIGGAAGAIPAVVGWTAVTGATSLAAWVMFALVFAWTPPHFWALSLRFSDDYARAAVPMLPVIAGESITSFQIVAYSVLVVAVSVVLAPIAGLGVVYVTAVLALGALLVWRAVGLRLGTVQPLAFFRFSNVYLALVFGAIALDVLADVQPLDPGPGRVIAAGSAVVMVGAEAVITAALRPRPSSWLEWVWLVLPPVGALALGVAVVMAVG